MIDHSVIKTVLIDRIEIIQKLHVFEREIVLEDNMPSILVGVRRCGKSYILYQKMLDLVKKGHNWNEFLYINFEDERLIGFELSDFQKLLDAFYTLNGFEPILFLDEIQVIENWENFARRIADEKRMVYITGSNSKLLSKEMETILGGRYLSKMVYPLSFVEYLSILDIGHSQRNIISSKSNSIIKKQFDEYQKYGGFPESIHLIDKRDYVSSIFNKLYLGDIIARNDIKNHLALEMMMKKLANSVRQPISFSRLTNTIKEIGISVGKSTIINFIEYAKEALVIFSLSNFETNFVEKISINKYYFIDNGLLNLFVSDAETSLLENLIAVELIRRYGNENVFYYQNGVEVDFYIPSEKLAIQSAYSIMDEKAFNREVNALVKTSKHLEINKSLIITYDEKFIIDDDIKIEVMPAWEWFVNH